MAADLPSLLGLWRGDEDCAAYESVKLAHEICKLLRPFDLTALFAQLFPQARKKDGSLDFADIPEESRVCAAEGFKWYQSDLQRAREQDKFRRTA